MSKEDTRIVGVLCSSLYPTLGSKEEEDDVNANTAKGETDANTFIVAVTPALSKGVTIVEVGATIGVTKEIDTMTIVERGIETS